MKDDLILRVARGAPLTHRMSDDNLQRLMYWSGPWAAGTYEANEVVQHHGGNWVCVATTGSTTDEPNLASPNWQTLGPLPGRGGLSNSASSVSAVLAAYQKITILDTIGLAAYGTTLDTVLSEFAWGFVGLWQITIEIFFSHDSFNNGRTTNVRLFNKTDAAPSGALPIGIGRNVTESSFSVTLTEQTPAADVGDLFYIEIGGGDTLNDFVINNIRVTLLQIGVA